MIDIKIENWNGFSIRFIEKDGEWWAVASDVCEALGLKQVSRALRILKKGVTKCKTLTTGGEQEVNIINEKAIYKLAFKSRKKEAEDFQDWVVDIVKELRRASGYEGFEIFRMLDKEHQKEMMRKLSTGFKEPKRIDFIKANTIANKAVSLRHGYPKMIKKAQMSAEMLVEREKLLADTVELMIAKEKFGLAVSINEKIYERGLL